MEELAMGFTREGVTVFDRIKLCIKSDFGLLNNRMPRKDEIVSIIRISGYAEIRKF